MYGAIIPLGGPAMDDDDLEEMRRMRRSRGYADDRPMPSGEYLRSRKEESFGASLIAHFGITPRQSVKPLQTKDTSDLPQDTPSHGFRIPSLPDQSRRNPQQGSQPANVDDDDDDDDFGPQLPTKSAVQNIGDDDDDSFGPDLPPQSTQPSIDLSVINEYQLPISHQVSMAGHGKAVSSMTLDRSGSRLITGGYDYMMRFWDFNGMDRRTRAFREIEPDSGHQIVDLAYSFPTPNRVLVVTGSKRPLIFDRDGKQLAEFARGDMYLRDMKNTMGHVCGCVGGQWVPTDPNLFITAAGDGTVRIWDVNKTSKARDVIKVKADRGRLPVTSCTVSSDAKLLAAACQDGSLQIWDNNSRFVRPRLHIRNAHEANTSTSRIVFTKNGEQLISRGGDNTIKAWDVRNFKGTLEDVPGLVEHVPETDVILSPDERLIVGCVSAKRGEGQGSLVFIDRQTLEVVQTVAISDGAAIRVIWNEAINQICVGCADFNVHVLYNPDLSTKGAMLCVGRKPKKKDPMDFHAVTVPHIYGEVVVSRKRQREKDALDPRKGKIPELPIGGKGRGGAIGSSFSKYMLAGMAQDTSQQQDVDPREAILSHAEKAKADPIFFGRAYAETQPIPIFDTSEHDEDQADNNQSR